METATRAGWFCAESGAKLPHLTFCWFIPALPNPAALWRRAGWHPPGSWRGPQRSCCPWGSAGCRPPPSPPRGRCGRSGACGCRCPEPRRSWWQSWWKGYPSLELQEKSNVVGSVIIPINSEQFLWYQGITLLWSCGQKERQLINEQRPLP